LADGLRYLRRHFEPYLSRGAALQFDGAWIGRHLGIQGGDPSAIEFSVNYSFGLLGLLLTLASLGRVYLPSDMVVKRRVAIPAGREGEAQAVIVALHGVRPAASAPTRRA
jgi:hypothetical protein